VAPLDVLSKMQTKCSRKAYFSLEQLKQLSPHPYTYTLKPSRAPLCGGRCL